MFRLHILQSLMAVDEAVAPLSAVSPPTTTTPLVFAGNSRIVSDVMLSINGWNATISQPSGKSDSPLSHQWPRFRASFHQLKIQLDTSISHALPEMNRTRKITPQCTCLLDKSEIAHVSENLYMQFGDVRIRLLGKASPKMAVATVDSLAFLIQESHAMYKVQTRHSTVRRQHLLWNVLQHCRGTRVGDPLAQTQPSLLVQLGRPLWIRQDTSWKLFGYLRHCLRRLDPHQRRLLQMETSVDTNISYVQLNDLYSILIEQLPEWGHELKRGDVSALPFVQRCFSTKQPSKEELRDRKGRPLPALSFHFGTLSFTVFEHLTPDEDFGNTFALGPFHIVYRQQQQKKTTNGVPHPELQSSHSTRHHVLMAVIKDICLTIHPTFIIFLQQLLPLHGIYFRQTLTVSMDAPPSASPPLRLRDEFWECFIEARKVSVQAAVEGMVLEVGMDHVSFVLPLLQTIPELRTQSRLQRNISGNCLLKFSQLYTRVRQAQDKSDPFRSNGRDILTSLLFSSVTIDASHRVFGKHPLIIHGVLAIDSVLLSVPRSALLTYRLIEEWRIQYLPCVSLPFIWKYTDEHVEPGTSMP